MLSNSRLVHQPHDHDRCINAALTRAKGLCHEKNVKLTVTREAVLTLLWQSHRPLGAYQIQDQLSKLMAKPIAPPTVYRAIEFLLDLSLIHRLPSLNAYIGCPFPSSHHSNLFMICNECGSAAEMADAALNEVLQAASNKANFVLQSQSVELFGRCPQCVLDNIGNEESSHV
ncbi:MAG: Fur family zinc uptake transcriptional regulator [Polaribacter sp.]|jgi:Fur family zinc uptake transcriptional regulator|tara:strand:+ start:3443 stop:3958 length:516 start_codon:yes stop_codon:yes gene_type:complete